MTFDEIRQIASKVEPDELRKLFEGTWRTYAAKRLVAGYKMTK